MVRRKYRALRITGWIVVSFVSLILLITIVFYAGREWILNRTLVYLNEQLPGEVEVSQMNLIPFRNFPDVSLQLRNVNFYESVNREDSLLQEPILFLNDIYVTLDVIDLIRGDFLVSEISMEKGFIRFEVYSDSVSNIEYALGIRWEEGGGNDTLSIFPDLKIELDEIMVSDILLIFDDRTRDDHVQLNVNQLESSFSYLPDKLDASIQLDVDINKAKYLTYRVETTRNLYLESEASLDPLNRKVDLKPSLMRISGLEMETWGTYDYHGEPIIDLAFRATNRGLEALNYVFRGILDLDEIEQIGSGSMYLSGTVNGPIKDALPVLRINGEADRIGFRIRSIQKDVSDISFKMYGTNGGKLDFSEGMIILEDFTATFPEGRINANISAKNLKEPEVELELNGELDLEGLEQMLKFDAVSNLSGHLKLDGEMEGSIGEKGRALLNEAGILHASLSDVGFNFHRDSAQLDSVRNLNGALFLYDSIMGAEELGLDFNGNHLDLRLNTENLLHYLVGMDRDVSASFSLFSEVMYPGTLLGDTSLSALVGDSINGLHFSAETFIEKEQLDRFIRHDSVPELYLSVDSFHARLPVCAEISDLNTSLSLKRERIELHHLNGRIGESRFDLKGTLVNYDAIIHHDTLSSLSLDFDLSSDLLRAEDLLTFNHKFLLPEVYRTEFLQDLRLQGDMELPAAVFLEDSASFDLNLNIDSLGWRFRYYPSAFDDFRLNLRRRGDLLIIDHLEGKVGESNLRLAASVQNFTDSLLENISGNLVVESDLLDINSLMKYQLPQEGRDTAITVDSAAVLPPKLDQISYPDFQFSLDVGELRYGDYNLYGLSGKLSSSRQKIIYMDQLATSIESGGRLQLDGEFNVSNPESYTLSAEFKLEDVNVNDLDFEMQSGDQTYTLKENFQGLVSADGLAEIFITPDFRFDVSTTTAMFNVKVANGALINFTPLQAVAKYLDNKDLNHVRFASLNNTFTLMDSRIYIPNMIVESTIGVLLIEGEQGLDNSYLYLLRLPNWLVRGAAKSRLTGADAQLEEEQIYEMRQGNFMHVTAWGDGEQSEVRLGDRRDRYRDQ